MKRTLKEFFSQHDIVATHIAKRSGINVTLFSQYVSGSKRPGKKQLDKINLALNELGHELLSVAFK